MPPRVSPSSQNNAGKSTGKTAEQLQAEKDVTRTSFKFSNIKGGGPKKLRLEYPTGRVYTDFTDYVRFNFVRYNPPFSAKNGGKYINPENGKAIENATALNIYNNSITEFVSAGLPAIVMYMPEDLGAEYGAEWGGKGFTNTGAGIMRAAGAGLNTESIQSGAGQIAQEFGNMLQRGPALVADIVAKGINSLPGKIGGNVDVNDVLGGIGGVILNPNAELLFTGFDLRNFGLNFKMNPKNEAEAKEIRDIVTTFKKAALPSLGASPGNTLNNLFKGDDGKTTAPKDNNRNFIGIPNLCIVEFMKGGELHPYISQFKPCAITNVSVSYTPDGQYATYTDGSPVATQLTLAFTESKLVYSDEISYGGPSF